MSANGFSINEFIVREIGYPDATKQEVVGELVRCKDCKHRPIDPGGKNYGQDLVFPDDDYKCPCRCGDQWYSWMPKDDWFCPNGERSED